MKSESLWTNVEVAAALSQNPGSVSWTATGISIDSRTLAPGDIFLALHGEERDAHDYVLHAAQQGAVAVIVDRPVSSLAGNYPQIVVPDTLKALWALGASRRQQSRAKVIALTGSVGKTTTKEFLRHLCEKLGETASAYGSYNNHWGVPLSLALMTRKEAYSILEVGMNHPGEIAPLAQLIQPHVGLITRIGEAHLGYLGSMQAIAEEKAEIFSGLLPHGAAVLNADDEFFPLLSMIARKKGAEHIISYGQADGADVRLLNVHAHVETLTTEASFALEGKTYTFCVPFLGLHRIQNLLGVLGVFKALQVDLQDVMPHLSTLSLYKGRGQVHRLLVAGRSFTVIDDGYNANPTSMRAGLEVLAATPTAEGGRRIAILGEMGELGDYAEAKHRDLSKIIQELKIDQVYACGPLTQHFYNDLPASLQGAYMTDIDALLPCVSAIVQPGDVVFVKGSKYTQVIRAVDQFLSTYPKA